MWYLRNLALATSRLCIAGLVDWNLNYISKSTISTAVLIPHQNEGGGREGKRKKKKRNREQLTANNRDVEWRALDPDIAAPKHGPEQTSVSRISLLLNLVAAVQLRVSARLHALLNRVIAPDCALVCCRVACVLSAVADFLVAFAVIARGDDLAAHEGSGGDCQGEGEDGEEFLDEHDDWGGGFGRGGVWFGGFVRVGLVFGRLN